MIYHLVESAQGEAYALRDTMEDAQSAVADGELWLDGAATCGHPDGPRWVAKRLPLRIREISEAERDSILEDGPPVLDREP